MTETHSLPAPGDRLGRWAQILSIGCAIHCLAMPLLVAALPLIGMRFLLDERVETAVILGSLALATTSLALGFRSHRKRRVMILLIAAAALMIGGRFVDGAAETIMTTAGAVILAATQFLNRRLAGCCSGCHVHTRSRTGAPAHEHGHATAVVVAAPPSV